MKFAKFADALIEAVAPVKMRVGGYRTADGDSGAELVVLLEAKSSGSMLWEKLNAPRL